MDRRLAAAIFALGTFAPGWPGAQGGGRVVEGFLKGSFEAYFMGFFEGFLKRPKTRSVLGFECARA